MPNYRDVKLCEIKSQETEKGMANFQMSQTVGVYVGVVLAHQPHFTHNLALCFFFASSSSMSSSSNHDDHVWRWQGLFHSLKTLLMERVERFNSFQNRWEGLQRHLCH